MRRKVLISDDLGSINRGVLAVLDTFSFMEVHSVQYCDDAYLKIKKALNDKDPYHLFITDLSFKSDYRKQRYQSGEELIAALRHEVPDLKVIAYSVEDRLQKIKRLISNPNVKGYVCKGRSGLKELTEAITAVCENRHFVSPQIAQAMLRKDDFEITDYDISLVKQLSEGLSQEEISLYFKRNNIMPCGLSSIEKHLNRLKIQFKANNVTQLVAIIKDLGLI
ncbi:MAG: response regulator [Flavobacteriaceae bacterium]|nr:response regulator [Flavobacteriaceae bacterium]